MQLFPCPLKLPYTVITKYSRDSQIYTTLVSFPSWKNKEKIQSFQGIVEVLNGQDGNEVKGSKLASSTVIFSGRPCDSSDQESSLPSSYKRSSHRPQASLYLYQTRFKEQKTSTVWLFLSILQLLIFPFPLPLNSFETGSFHVPQASLELVAILLPQPPKCWDSRHAPRHPTSFLAIKPNFFHHKQKETPAIQILGIFFNPNHTHNTLPF